MAEHRKSVPPSEIRSESWVSGFTLTMHAIVASFGTYFCMYAFRKPFSAATYDGLSIDIFLFDEPVKLKTAFVVSQIFGYALSKIIGIRICSEVTPARRAASLVGLILAAELALLLFAVVPNDWKVLAIFLNGVPLGMVWGLVVWYLEGRRTSEMLLAGLSCSFIVASGVVKDVGLKLMGDYQVDQFWMPFVAGALFLPLFLFCVWLLNKLPAPTAADIAERVSRTPMTSRERWDFVWKFAPGLLMLLLAYFFLTAYRDFRDNFGVDIFRELRYGEDDEGLFTRSELLVAFGVMAALAGLNLIRDNRLGLIGAFVVMGVGTLTLAFGTLLFDMGLITGFTWMVLCGLGSYLAYVPFGSVLFDRLIASTRAVGTAVFAIYVADAIGYGGAITVLLSKDLLAEDLSRLAFFRYFTYGMAGLGTLCLAASCFYFVMVHLTPRAQDPDSDANTLRV